MSRLNISPDIPARSEGKPEVGVIHGLLTIAVAVLIGVLHTPSIYQFDEPPAYRIPVFAAVVGLIFILSLGRMGKFSKSKLVLLFLWAGFATIELTAGLIHNEDPLALIWLYLGVPYLILCVFPQAAGRFGNRMVLLAIVLAFLPYIIASLILYPLSSPYLGVFSNPNSFGMAVATMSAGLLGLLRGAISIERKTAFQRTWTVFLCLAVSSAFPLIVVSNSRTSLITYALMLIIFSWSLLFNKYKNRWWIALTVVVVLGAFSTVLVSGLSDDARFNYFGRIVEKMTTKTESGDVSAGRFDIWRNALLDVDLFGRGGMNFQRLYGGPPHNTYIAVIGSAGPIAVIFLLSIHVLAVFVGYRRIIRNIDKDGYVLGPLLVVVNYLMLGLAELVFGILGNGINMSFLLMLGILVSDQWTDERLVVLEKDQGAAMPLILERNSR